MAKKEAKKKVVKKASKKKAIKKQKVKFCDELIKSTEEYHVNEAEESCEPEERYTAKDGDKYAEEVFYPMFKLVCEDASKKGEYEVDPVYVFCGLVKDDDGYVSDCRCSKGFLQAVMKKCMKLGKKDGLDAWFRCETFISSDTSDNNTKYHRSFFQAAWG